MLAYRLRRPGRTKPMGDDSNANVERRELWDELQRMREEIAVLTRERDIARARWDSVVSKASRILELDSGSMLVCDDRMWVPIERYSEQARRAALAYGAIDALTALLEGKG